jgi:hypothetical protein
MFYGRYADYTMFPHLDVLKILVVGDEDELVKVLLALDMAELSGDSPIVGDMVEERCRHVWSLPRRFHKLEMFCFTNKRGLHVRKKIKAFILVVSLELEVIFSDPDFRGRT